MNKSKDLYRKERRYHREMSERLDLKAQLRIICGLPKGSLLEQYILSSNHELKQAISYELSNIKRR